jgi:hypothetical protein
MVTLLPLLRPSDRPNTALKSQKRKILLAIIEL